MISRFTTCPHCSTRLSLSERIADKTLICPRCLADMDNAWPGSHIRADDINTDVKSDLSVGSIVLAVLMGLCVLGMAMAIGNTAILFAERLVNLFISGAALLVLGCIAIIRRRGRRGNDGETVGTVFLVLGTIVAIAIFGFFCCAAGVSESLRHMH
jgi:hypothetical protein